MGNAAPRRKARLGGKIRALRRRQGITQARLAERLGISASYLNLIESNRRPLPAALLIELARLFELDIASLGGEEDARLEAHLLEVFSDPIFESDELTRGEIEDLSAAHPSIARAILSLFHAYQEARGATETLATRLAGGDEHVGLDRARLPSEEVSDLIQRQDNYFPEIEEAAESLVAKLSLDRDDLFNQLARHLLDEHGVGVRIEKAPKMGRAVRRFDRERRELVLSEVLRRGSRNIQLAHQIGLLSLVPVFERFADDPALTTAESRTLCRVALANYFAAAVVMPYDAFLGEARESRYDIELLGHRFRAGFEQVCHRLTTLKRQGAEGVPFHFVRIDIAGNISKRFGASGIRFPRFSGLCPRWNVHQAFLTPGRISVQLSRMPDGTNYFTMARTLPKQSAGYRAPVAAHAVGIGCHVRYARELVYSDGVDIESAEVEVPIGVTCRVCERTDCEQRAFPSLQTPLRIDPDVRGLAFYAPVRSEPDA